VQVNKAKGTFFYLKPEDQIEYYLRIIPITGRFHQRIAIEAYERGSEAYFEKIRQGPQNKASCD